MTSEEVIAQSGNSAWMPMSASLILLVTPALTLFYGGMPWQKSILSMMMMNFDAVGAVGTTYVLWDWSISYGSQSIGGVFTNPFRFFGLRNSITDGDGNYIADANGYPNVIDIEFQLTFCSISVALISGALAERVRFSTWLIFVGFWTTLVHFPMASMVWGGGLLSHSAESLSAKLFGTADGEALIAPVDFAGGMVIYITADTAALVLATIIGKRKSIDGNQHHPHNLPLVMLDTALLWFGWFGFSDGSAFATDNIAGLAWLNTTVAACVGMLDWISLKRIHGGHPTSLGAASGIIAGLVTITPTAGGINPVTSIILGYIGGALGCWGAGSKYRFNFDDILDAVGLHLVVAVWGTIGIGLLANDRGLLTGGGIDGLKLFAIQVTIAVIAAVLSDVLTYIIAWVLKATVGWCVHGEQERSGIDVAQYGESACTSAKQATV